MVGPDSDSKYHPQEGEIQKPRWVDVVQQLQNFPEGSMGFDLGKNIGVGTILEGRKRSETVFQRPVTWLYNRKSNRDVRQLENVGLATISDILKLSPGDLNELLQNPKKAENIRTRAQQDLQGFVAGLPQARLLRAIYEYRFEMSSFPRKYIDWSVAPIIVPARYEQEMIGTVEQALLSIEAEEKNLGEDVIRMHFGLDDGIPQSIEKIGKSIGVTSSSMRTQESQTESRLIKLDSKVNKLELLVPLPVNSFGALAFGANIYRELPDVFRKEGYQSVSEIISELSPFTISELTEHLEDFSKDSSLKSFLFLDLSKSLTQGAEDEIIAHLQRKATQIQIRDIVDDATSLLKDQEYKQDEEIIESLIKISPEEIEQQKQIGNILVPQLRLTPEQMDIMKGQYISNILSYSEEGVEDLKRAKVETLGDLFALTRDELLQIPYKKYGPDRRFNPHWEFYGLFSGLAVGIAEVLNPKPHIPIANSEELGLTGYDALGWDLSVALGTAPGQEGQAEKQKAVEEAVNRDAHLIFRVLDLDDYEKTTREGYKPISEAGLRKLRSNFNLSEKRKKIDESEITSFRDIIAKTKAAGHETPEEIHQWIVENEQSPILNVNKTSWKIRAMIEYVLNHPEEKPEES